MADEKPKRRKLGIRVKKQEAREWGWTTPCRDGVELFDVETGEAFEGVIEMTIAYPLHGAVKAKLEIFVAKVDSFERAEEYTLPVTE